MQLKVFGISIQTLLTMKLLILLTAVACLQVSAKGFSQSVSMSLKNASLETAFKEITRQTGYSFIYTRDQLKNTSSISCELSNASIKATLDICFRGQPLEYVVEGTYVIVQSKSPTIVKAESAIETVTVTGRILNENGE